MGKSQEDIQKIPGEEKIPRRSREEKGEKGKKERGEKIPGRYPERY